MIHDYQYTPHIWPMLISAGVMIALASYTWRRRAAPGAVYLTLMMVFGAVWALMEIPALLVVDSMAKIRWSQVASMWGMPTITARLYFALSYANPERGLHKRTHILLIVCNLVIAGLMLSNESHHLIWSSFSLEGNALGSRLGVGYWAVAVCAYAISLASILVFLRLFIRSPLHRWSAALIMIGMLMTTGTHLAVILGLLPSEPVKLVLVTPIFSSVVVIVALFRLHMFELIPIARETVIEQMREGMIVLDTQHRVRDLNRAAEQFLKIEASRAIGQGAVEILPDGFDWATWLAASNGEPSEISLETGGIQGHYLLYRSVLHDHQGLPRGYLILFNDITEQQRAMARIVEQQRALAMLQERAQLAREFHDGLGQVLGYVKLQTWAVRDMLAEGQTADANARLTKLASVVQDAHTDVREYLLGAGNTMTPSHAFLGDLRTYLRQFSETHGLPTDLDVPQAWPEGLIEPTVAVQLLRIIQEALTNARKHAHPTFIQVHLAVRDTQLCAEIQDDGTGFDPGQAGDGRHGYGLRFMQERAEMVKGTLNVESAPRTGTTITVCVPCKAQHPVEAQ